MTIVDIADLMFPASFKKTPLLDELASLRTAIKTAVLNEFKDSEASVEIITFMNTVTLTIWQRGGNIVTRTSQVTNESLL